MRKLPDTLRRIRREAVGFSAAIPSAPAACLHASAFVGSCNLGSVDVRCLPRLQVQPWLLDLCFSPGHPAIGGIPGARLQTFHLAVL